MTLKSTPEICKTSRERWVNNNVSILDCERSVILQNHAEASLAEKRVPYMITYSITEYRT